MNCGHRRWHNDLKMMSVAGLSIALFTPNRLNCRRRQRPPSNHHDLEGGDLLAGGAGLQRAALGPALIVFSGKPKMVIVAAVSGYPLWPIGCMFRHIKPGRRALAEPILMVQRHPGNPDLLHLLGQGLACFLARHGYQRSMADLRGRGLSTPAIAEQAEQVSTD